MFGDDRAAIRGGDAPIVLRIVVLAKGTTTSVAAFETLECIECALGIAQTKGQVALREEYLRLASLNPRRANRRLTSAVADGLFAEGAKVITARARNFPRDHQQVIVLHSPYYQIELESGRDRVTAGFYAVDFEDKTFPSNRSDAIGFVRKLVAASGLRASN